MCVAVVLFEVKTSFTVYVLTHRIDSLVPPAIERAETLVPVSGYAEL